MKVCGIVCEYNPFHCGHEYQLNKVREHADTVVAVMSGSFTQRGEAALFDKWTRAAAAVSCGVNLVVELPFFAACSPAEYFAATAVKMLAHFADSLCFGSESGDINQLRRAAACDENSYKIKVNLAKGQNYSKASAHRLSEPNNILGIEYIRAVEKYAPHIVPFTIKRRGERYDSTDTSGMFASAAGCRRLISEGADISAYVPRAAAEIYKSRISNGETADLSRLDALFCGMLRRESSFLKHTAYVSEGIENRFYKAADMFSEIESIASYVKSKRYTRARINRIIINALIGITADMQNEFSSASPQYAHILAADEIGLKLLKTACLPMITNGAQAKRLTGLAKKIWDTECIATDLHSLCMANPAARGARHDYTHFFGRI